VTALEFLKSFDPAAPAPIYLIGPYKPPRARNASFEPLLAERAAERIVSELVDPTMRDMVYGAYYADETPAEEIVSTAETFPFLVERRVVLVRNAERYETESAGAPMLRYLASPNATCVLVLIAAKLDKRSKFYKACLQQAVLVECGELRDRELAEWVRAEATTLGKKIEPAAVREVTDRAGARLSDVNNALQLTANFVGERETITQEDVEAAASQDVAEEEIWTLTDAIASSDMAAAVKALRKLLELGKNEFEIMGSVNWLLKSAYAVAAGQPEGAPSVAPFVQKKVTPLAKKLGVRKLRDAFSLCMDMEVMLRSTGVDKRLALELLIIKLSAPRRRARRAS
jgi:DNA polymerase-3 subunit delta